MINWISNLLGKNKTQDNADVEQDEKPIESCYYKVKVKSYYGLCGIKVTYGEAYLIDVPSELTTKPEDGYDYHILSHEQSMSVYVLVVPKGAEFVSEQEYLEGISK